MMRHKKKTQSGQGMVEYLVIVAIIAISSIGIIKVLSQTLRIKFSQVTASLQDRQGPKNAQLKKVSRKHWRLKGMGDLNSGVLNNEK